MMGPGGDKVGRRIGQFITTKWIGSGGFGHVYLAKNVEDNQEYAVKILDKKEIDKHPEMKRLLQTEVGIMGDIDHPNILKLKEFLESSKNYYIVMQYCNKGDFESYLSKQPKNYLEEKEALYFLKQIMNGFQVLRQKEVMHRDFKLANIFLNNNTLVIGDFGFARAGHEMAQTNVGTPLTKAPELHKNVSNYNSKADLWSIGVVFYQLLYGTYPFYALSILELMHQIENYSGNNVRFRDDINVVSDKAKDLIKRLLQPDPDKRIAWEDFFKHPVFEDEDSKGSVKKEILDSIVDTVEIDDEFKKNQSLSKQQKDHDQSPQVNNKAGALAPITIVESGSVLDSQLGKTSSTGFQTNGSLDASSASKDGLGFSHQSHQSQPAAISPTAKAGTGSPQQLGILRQIKDIAARYHHEKNKILMILMTAGRLRQMMKEKHFESANKDLYLLISLLTKKGSMLSELTLMSLKMQNNIFKQKDFEEFCKSEDYVEVCAQLAKDQKGVFEYRDHITNLRSKVATSEEDNVLLSQIGQGYVDLKFLDEKAMRAFERTRLLDQVVLKMQTEQTRYYYFLTMILVIYAIKSEYYIQFVQDGQRFDWDVFKTKYETTNTNTLWTVLSTLTKENDIQIATK